MNFGANGRAGPTAVAEALSRGNDVTAVVREDTTCYPQEWRDCYLAHAGALGR